MDPVTNDPLKAAMLALRNSRAQAQAPPETAPAEAAAPPPPAVVTKPKPAGKPKAKKAPGWSKGARSPKSATSPRPTTPVLVPEIVEDCENGISDKENGILEKGIDDILAESGISEASAKNLLTPQELKFVDLYLSGEYSQTKAMILAGYTNPHVSYLKLKAQKIMAKHESLAGDARKILRAMGLGEIHIAWKIKELMEDTSKSIQLRATELAAKCLGMFKDSEVSINQGIQIIIKGRDEHSPGPAVQINQQVNSPRVIPRTMAITK
jgi:hypothetical protein